MVRKRLRPYAESPWKDGKRTDSSELHFGHEPPDPISALVSYPLSTIAVATNQASIVKYRIRLLSAKPVRQAFARLIALDQPSEDPRIKAHMDDFVGRQFDRWIAVTVDVEARDQRFSATALQALASATTESLKNKTYLERKDGKRLFLHMYQAPSPDGLGAKYIFNRIVDERQFLNDESGEVRFVSEVGKVKLDIRFKVSEMKYDGQLEY